MEAGADVRFDFEGSLALARQLWSLAEELDELMTHRGALAAEALRTWLGVYGTEFAGRIDTEAIDVAAITTELRRGAHGWADNWKQAMDQQNRVLWARRVQAVERERGALDNFVGFFVGHDDLPSQPEPADTPSAPGFWATRSFVRY